jgi:ABC-2 type transport system ATP-binding protein
MKRRLNLAVALVHDPPLLLLDEPTVGVDPQSRNAILENIRALKREGKAVFYTTHYMEEAQRLCDRVGILDQGRLLALDTVENLIEAYGEKTVITAETRTGEVKTETDDPMAELQKLQRRNDIITLRVERPNLENVFLRLTGKQLRD